MQLAVSCLRRAGFDPRKHFFLREPHVTEILHDLGDGDINVGVGMLRSLPMAAYTSSLDWRQAFKLWPNVVVATGAMAKVIYPALEDFKNCGCPPKQRPACRRRAVSASQLTSAW